MIKKIIMLFPLIFLFLLGKTSEATTIRVGLADKYGSAALSSSSSMQIKDRKGIKISGRSLTFTASGGYLLVGDKKMTPPVDISSASPVVYDKRPYLGIFQLLVRGNAVIVVNVLDVESYLRGVLKMEANPEWPVEALKAQAIISRTYALNQLGRHGSSGFDVCPYAHCQLYRGINAHDPKTDKAVSATKGKVLTYQGKLARTFFHSDSGGKTAAARDVWGGDFPYLRSVPDPVPSGSPYSRWTTTLTGEQIGNALGRSGYRVGKVTSISVMSRDNSDRAMQLEIYGTGGRVTIQGHKFREAIGTSTIRSTVFNIRGSVSAPSSPSPVPAPAPVNRPTFQSGDQLSVEEERLLLTLTKQGAFSSEELIDMLMDSSKKRIYLQKKQGKAPQPLPSTSTSTRRPQQSYGGSSFVFDGQGWGHGVGLSQWGARALALSGWSAEKILTYYYPGTAITTRQ